MIYDVIPFFMEFEILRIRLEELSDIVDKFIIVESPYTFTMKEKPYYLYEKLSSSDTFNKYVNKINLLKIPKKDMEGLIMKTKSDIHFIERFQRNYPTQYLKENCKDEDVIIFSDVDEIPSVEAVNKFINSGRKFCRFETKLFRYKLNLFFQYWHISHMLKWKEMLNWINNIDSIRYKAKPIVLKDAGWHFSSVGNFEQIWQKLSSKSSANEPRVQRRLSKERVKSRIERGLHPFKDGKALGKYVPISEMPDSVIKNAEYYFKKGLL